MAVEQLLCGSSVDTYVTSKKNYQKKLFWLQTLHQYTK